MGTGVNLSKATVSAVVGPPTGVSLSKAVAYAVLDIVSATPIYGSNTGTAPTKSWVEMPTVIVDYAVSYQEINRIRDNIDYLRQLVGVAHSLNATAGRISGSQILYSTQPWTLYGHHTEKTVARSALHFAYSLFGGTTPTMTADLSNTAYVGITRNGTGDYFVSMPGLSAYASGLVTPEYWTAARYAHARYSASPAGFVVALCELNAGNWDRKDYSFTLTVHEGP